MKLILATTSPHRIEAFKALDIDFESKSSNVDESQLERNDPEELVKELSKLKAEAIIKDCPDSIIVGFDSVGHFNDLILEKPKSREEAFERLKSLSGNSHQFYTGIYMVNTSNQKVIRKVVKTEFHMREINEDEINKYLDQDSRYNTYALGFDPLGHYSSTFIKEISGSYNNLLKGIPLEVVVEMLADMGYKN